MLLADPLPPRTSDLRRKSTLGFSLKHAAPRWPDIASALMRPQLRDILDTIDRVRGAIFLIMAPTQTLKSLAGQLIAMRNLLIEPGPALWYGPAKDTLEKFCDEKPNPLFDSLAVLQPLLLRTPSGSPDPSKRDRLRYQLAGQHLLFLSAGADGNRQSKTARTIFVDEPWLYEPGWLKQISRRRSSYDEDASWREIHMSTGAVIGEKKGGEFAQLWRTSDNRRWHLRCPACAQFFEARYSHDDPKTGERIGGIIYETHLGIDGLPDEPRIAATVRHRCPHCRHELPDTNASRLALSGTFEQPLGKYQALNPSPAIAPPVIGWQMHGIALKSWTPIVIDMIKAQLARQRGDLEPMKDVVRLQFGDIYDPEKHLRERKARPTAGYKMLEDWDREMKDDQGRPMRTAGIDVQEGYFVLVVRKWAADSQSRLHFAEKILAPETLKKRLDECGVISGRVFLDARHRPEHVHKLCGFYGWRSVLGESEKTYLHQETGHRRIFSTPKPIDPWIGTGSQGKVTVWEYNFSKPSALERWQLLRTVPRNDKELHWSVADDAPDWYFEEIEAFRRVKKLSTSGEPYYEWVAHGPDHGSDAECITVVIASQLDLAGAESLGETPPSPT